MAKVYGYMYCDQITANNVNGKLVPSVFMPLTSIPVSNLPTEKSFALCICVADIDVSSDHELQLVLKHNGNVLVDMGKTLLEKGKTQEEAFLSADIRNLKVAEEGEITIEMCFDGEVIGSFPIRIHQVGGD